MFSSEQVEQLNAPLSREVVKTRSGFSYIEGWHALAEANRIFGFDGWSSETMDVRCLVERERERGGGHSVTYAAKVRVTAGGVCHDGCGAGTGVNPDLGLAHEKAIKEAETDARKRALMQFGFQFGLALYDKEQANVADGVDALSETDRKFIVECEKSIERIGAHPNPLDLLNWWNSDVEKKKRRDFDLPQPEVDRLRDLVSAKVKEMSERKK